MSGGCGVDRNWRGVRDGHEGVRIGPTGAGLRVWGLANIFVAALIAGAVGTAVRWMLLVRSIRRIINKAACPFCEFSLVGLRVEHGWVRCPECGQRVYLHEHRLTPDDLVPEHERNRPLPGIGAGDMGGYAKRDTRAAGRK